MNTLVYHFGGLGDFITALPAIAVWKRLHNATITLLGKPAFGRLACKAGYIDAFIDADSISRMFLFRQDSDETKLRQFFAPFDAMLLFAAANSPLIDNARRYSRATILCQPPFPDKRIPAVDYHLSLVSPAASFTAAQRTPVISIPCTAAFAEVEQIRTSNRRMVAIHPGSGSRIKNWPLEGFLAVARKLRTDGYTNLWIAGPAEDVKEFPATDLSLINQPLCEIAAVLSHCALFIGNDSGITHLAAACGCPTIAIFGPSDPVIWGPRGTNGVRIITHPPPCAPCHLKTDNHFHCSFECMYCIRPEEIITVADRILRG